MQYHYISDAVAAYMAQHGVQLNKRSVQTACSAGRIECIRMETVLHPAGYTFMLTLDALHEWASRRVPRIRRDAGQKCLECGAVLEAGDYPRAGLCSRDYRKKWHVRKKTY